MAVRRDKMKIIIIIFSMLTLSIKISVEYKNNLDTYIKKIYEVKNKKCRFSKKGLSIKKYDLGYTIIEGYWKNNTPFGEWRELSYTKKILKTQCYIKDEIYFKSYSYGKIATVTYINKASRLDGGFNEKGDLVSVLYFSHLDGNFSLEELFTFKNGVWVEKDMGYPSILDLDLDTYLYLIDKDKKKGDKFY
jgi:hypothetical protein